MGTISEIGSWERGETNLGVFCIPGCSLKSVGPKNDENSTFSLVKPVLMHGEIKGYVEPLFMSFWNQLQKNYDTYMVQNSVREFLTFSPILDVFREFWKKLF